MIEYLLILMLIGPVDGVVEIGSVEVIEHSLSAEDCIEAQRQRTLDTIDPNIHYTCQKESNWRE